MSARSRCSPGGSAELGDSKTLKGDAFREKPIHCNPARLGADRRAMRGACQGNASKMARKLPQNRGPRSAAVGHGNRGTMLRYLLALLACLERAAGPAGPTAALPQISPMEPTRLLFPGPNGAPLSRAALHNALRRLDFAGPPNSIGRPFSIHRNRRLVAVAYGSRIAPFQVCTRTDCRSHRS